MKPFGDQAVAGCRERLRGPVRGAGVVADETPKMRWLRRAMLVACLLNVVEAAVLVAPWIR